MTTLAEKRASLHASLEQHIGQVNRHNGAIAVLDELIAEEVEAAALPDASPVFGGIDRTENPYWKNYVNSPAVPLGTPQPAPEMLPVVRVGDHDEEPVQEEQGA